METRLAASIKDTPQGQAAEAILRACVHCGFCNATCPTYRILGDELDGPRGRIYQIKQVLEGATPTRQTQIHLDRCLTCRNCETTCPSGVQYGQLVDIGRAIVAERVRRPWSERLARWVLREGLTRPALFGTALRAGRALRAVLPHSWADKVGRARGGGVWPTQTHARKVLLLKGCTQPALQPSIDAATARVLDVLGIQCVTAPRSGCCGALRQHLDDQEGARVNARVNIDAWLPYIESGMVEAIIVNASGCGVMVKDYGHLLRDDPAYAPKAARVSGFMRDPTQFLAPALPELRQRLDAARAVRVGSQIPAGQRIAFQAPCTLQHGLKLRGEAERLLLALGAPLTPVADAHLCCGSAGTYSLLQPQLAQTLRTDKLGHLLRHEPDVVLSANIGCITHLQAATQTPVRHWLEWLDAELSGKPLS